MSYEQIKEFCKEAGKEEYSYLKIEKLDEEEKYCISNESKK